MKCRYCNVELSKDACGLNKKLFENDSKRKLFMCLSCMADILGCSVSDLIDKIEEFKREGCKLFG